MITKKNHLIALFFLSFTLNCITGQVDTALLTINGHKIYPNEFEWLFVKNNNGPVKSSIEDYLDLYISFKLKVEDAMEAGIHETQSFNKELAGYRKQLSRGYLTDQGIKEELLKKAYERYKTEINAYHVMVICPQDAIPEDTLEAYNKAMNIRERIRLGEPFEAVARGSSDDPFVTANGGNLGYFTVFQTPIAFENAVYSMNPGNLSRPVRAADGFHIIKVQDKRAASGRIRVAHIMQATPVGAGPEMEEQAKHIIDSLYKLITDGADFENLAREYSDDMGSAPKGGELPWFGVGEMVHEFSEASFALLRNGDISPPVRTAYGWHIIKRLEHQMPLSYEEAHNYLESKLNQSYLATLSRKSFADKLKKEYNYTLNESNLEWFYPLADSAFRAGGYNMGINNVPGRILYSFSDRELTMRDFASIISEKGYNADASDSVKFIRSILEMKVYDDLLSYEDSMLEQKYAEFRYLMNEFHDGILLFEISDSLIWKRSVTDTSGLRLFYETVKEEYRQEPSIEARIFTFDKKTGKKKNRDLIKVVRNNLNRENGEEIIINSSIERGDTLIAIEHINATRGENTTLDNIKWEKGIYTVKEDKLTDLVEIINTNSSQYMDFEEVKPRLSADYSAFLEIEWISQLRDRYTVILNEPLFNKLKQKYSDE